MLISGGTYWGSGASGSCATTPAIYLLGSEALPALSPFALFMAKTVAGSANGWFRAIAQGDLSPKEAGRIDGLGPSQMAECRLSRREAAKSALDGSFSRSMGVVAQLTPEA